MKPYGIFTVWMLFGARSIARIAFAAFVFEAAVVLVALEARSQQARSSPGPAVNTGQPADEQGQAELEATKDREERLRQMRERVEAMTVRKVVGDAKASMEVLPQPLFRYSDERLNMADATLWGWGPRGRPIAILKLENYRGSKKQPWWLHCMASLSDELIEAQWDDGHEWSSRKPGVGLEPLPDAPAPASTRTGTLSQMKMIARRFSATSSHPYWGKEELRLLPREICRYADPDSGLEDGAIFTFVYSGTIPTAFLVLELHVPESSPGVWQFGLAGMTDARLMVHIDGREVWDKPYLGGPVKQDTWTWFKEDTGRRRP